jgi:hypothetical protein
MPKNKDKNKKELLLGFDEVATSIEDKGMFHIDIDIDEELKELESHFGGVTTDDGGVDELLEELDKGSKKKVGKKLFEHFKSTVVDEISLKCINGEIETKKELKKLFKSRLGDLVHNEKNGELVKIYEKYKNSDDFEDAVDELFKLVKTKDKENTVEPIEVFRITDLEKKKDENKSKEETKVVNIEEYKSEKELKLPFDLKFRTIEDFGIKPMPFKRKEIKRTKLPC